jgi:hypothetical protein
MMYSTPLSREMFSVPNFPMRKKSGVHISAGNCTNHISQSNVNSFSKKSFSGRQAQNVSNVNPFSENNSLEFLLNEFAEEVSDAHLTAKVKHFFQKNKNSSLFVNDAHSFRFCDLIYTLGDVTTEEAVAAYLISLISLPKYSKSVKPEDFSGRNLLLYNTAKAFMETKYPPFTLKSLVELDDETFKALLVAACIMRKGKNLILNEVTKDYACISC